MGALVSQDDTRAPLIEHAGDGSGYSARLVEHFLRGDAAFYRFAVCCPWPSRHRQPEVVIERSYEEFEALSCALHERYGARTPDLPPPSLFFESTEASFLRSRGRGLASFLASCLLLEPQPRTRALRDFLHIWEPPEPQPDRLGGSSRLLRLAGVALPSQLFALALSFLSPAFRLRTAGAVCRAAHSSARLALCWPSIRASFSRLERWDDSFFSLLGSACAGMRAMQLELGYKCAGAGRALPSGLFFPKLEHLELRLLDTEAVSLASELVQCVESPSLRWLEVESRRLTQPLLSALWGACFAASGEVLDLRLRWGCAVSVPWPAQIGGLLVPEAEVLEVGALLEACPKLERLVLGITPELSGSGLVRAMEALEPQRVALPHTQPILADVAGLGRLVELTFDFLSDDVLVCLRSLAQRSFMLRRAHFSGSKSLVREPDEALLLLLDKLGGALEDFSLSIDVEVSLRPFLRGELRTRLGRIPELWRDRGALRSLSLNYSAFDDDGILCLAESCPQLDTLQLDRAEYWTDSAVQTLVDLLPLLRRFRIRPGPLLSDRSLCTLISASDRLVRLELERSDTMSSCLIEQLRHAVENTVPEEGVLESLLGISRPVYVGGEQWNSFVRGTFVILRPEYGRED